MEVARGAVVGALLVGIAASCTTSFGAADSPSESLPPSRSLDDGSIEERSDATTPAVTEGGADASGTDAGDVVEVGVTNLVLPQESGFEGGTENACASGNFASFHGTHVKDQASYSGAWSCRICHDVSAASYTLDTSSLAVKPAIGAHFKATARVQNVNPSTQKLRIVLRTWTNDPSNEIEVGTSSPVTLESAGWTLLSTELTITKGADVLDLYIAADGPQGACFRADEIVAWRD